MDQVPEGSRTDNENVKRRNVETDRWDTSVPGTDKTHGKIWVTDLKKTYSLTRNRKRLKR